MKRSHGDLARISPSHCVRGSAGPAYYSRHYTFYALTQLLVERNAGGADLIG